MLSVLRLNRCVQVLKQTENTVVRSLTDVNINNNKQRLRFPEESKRWSSQYVIKSSYSDVEVATIPIHESVWQDLDKWSRKSALVCGITGRSYTYEEARSSAYSFAKALLGLGLQPGDVIALLLPNMPEYPIVFLGASEAGLVVTTVNPVSTREEVDRHLQASNAVAAVTVPQLLPLLPEASLRSVFVVDEANTGCSSSGNIHSFLKIIRGEHNLGPSTLPKVDVTSTATLLFSSGTTGVPKGVMLTHRNIVTNIAQTDHPGLCQCKPTNESYQDKVLILLPMYHVYGLFTITMARLTKGMEHITLPKFDPKTYVSTLENNKFTMLYLVPPLVNFMAVSPDIKPRYLESVHAVVCGAAPLSPSLLQKFFEKTKCPANFQEGYGMTEASPVITFSPKNPRNDKVGSCGTAVANTELKIIDTKTGETLGPNKTGEVCVKGPQVMKGYLNNPKATAETIDKDGWLHTGDLGYADEDTFLFVVDRLKELIKVKGLQVAPAELEEILLTHPDVKDAAVIGIPDERSGEIPRAFVVSSNTSKESARNISKYVEQKVSPYKKISGGIVFVDAIPKSPAGKILRKLLKHL